MRSEDLLEQITVDPKVMVGKPVIRGTRIPVALILKMLSQGHYCSHQRQGFWVAIESRVQLWTNGMKKDAL